MVDKQNIKFLVPIDFSEQSAIALEQACSLARVYNASICLFYVIGLSSGVSQAKNKENEQGLNDLYEELKTTTNLTIEKEIEKGNVVEKILGRSDKSDITLIVMGTGGTEGSIVKMILKTVAIKIITQAKCPVITIKGKHHRKGCKNIVVPLDLTETTTQKVEYAIKMANVFKGATIRLVSIINTTNEARAFRLTKLIEEVRDYVEKREVECIAEMVKVVKGEESLARTIIDYANKVEGDLLLIMTQQESGIRKLMLGSAAQEIINHSDIPVMSIAPNQIPVF